MGTAEPLVVRQDVAEVRPQGIREHRVKGIFREDLQELKARVAQVETTLARGVLLLVANLAGMVITLARQLV